MDKLKMIKFWVVAFSVIIWHSIKGNGWHMITADFHLGDNKDGTPIRKKLIAKKSINSLDVYWQEINNG